MQESIVIVAARGKTLLGTFRLATKKPWAIDRTIITPVKRPLFLVAMAVHPRYQRLGVGRRLIDEAIRIAREWPADSIVLDAYDADAGAGDFYAKCGFTEIGRQPYKGNPLRYFEMLL